MFKRCKYDVWCTFHYNHYKVMKFGPAPVPRHWYSQIFWTHWWLYWQGSTVYWIKVEWYMPWKKCWLFSHSTPPWGTQVWEMAVYSAGIGTLLFTSLGTTPEDWGKEIINTYTHTQVKTATVCFLSKVMSGYWFNQWIALSNVWTTRTCVMFLNIKEP